MHFSSLIVTGAGSSFGELATPAIAAARTYALAGGGMVAGRAGWGGAKLAGKGIQKAYGKLTS